MPDVIRKIGFKPGDLKATLTGVLTEVSQADGQMKRKSLKIGDSKGQSYILLESAELFEALKNAPAGEPTTLSGIPTLYEKNAYLWFLPDEPKQKESVDLNGQFLTKGDQLIFRDDNTEYVVVENDLREHIEKAGENPQKKWSIKGLVSEYKGIKYLFLKVV